MSLKQQIDNDIKKAMLAKEKDALRTLRALKSAILLAETEKGAQEELSADKELAILQKAAKQRKESAEIYAQQQRTDLADNELIELEVIERYLPKQLSDEELTAALTEIIAKVGAASPADMGKVMGAASGALAGKADGKRISAMVKTLLS